MSIKPPVFFCSRIISLERLYATWTQFERKKLFLLLSKRKIKIMLFELFFFLFIKNNKLRLDLNERNYFLLWNKKEEYLPSNFSVSVLVETTLLLFRIKFAQPRYSEEDERGDESSLRAVRKGKWKKSRRSWHKLSRPTAGLKSTDMKPTRIGETPMGQAGILRRPILQPARLRVLPLGYEKPRRTGKERFEYRHRWISHREENQTAANRTPGGLLSR